MWNLYKYKFFFRFDGSSFLTAASAKYEHYHTSLGKLSEGLIAISGYSSASGVTVELFANGKWYQQPDFPEERSFAYYSTITYENRLYIFGNETFIRKAHRLNPRLSNLSP